MKVEVKEAPSQEVDWTNNPQLVISRLTNAIVLVHEDQTDRKSNNKFVGTKVSEPDFSEYSNDWVKLNFKPFNGEITLKND